MKQASKKIRPTPAVPMGTTDNPGEAAHIVVGISGGVDSAVSLLLLKEQGLRVEAVFMKNWDEDDGSDWCTAARDLDDARAICARLQVPLRDVNFSHEYWEDVFEAFLA